MTNICWEHQDGSAGEVDVEEQDAESVAFSICIDNPSARVWIGERIVQRGFIASDEIE